MRTCADLDIANELGPSAVGSAYRKVLIEQWLKQFGNRCDVCDDVMLWLHHHEYRSDGERAASLDHIVPQAVGGTDRLSNIRVICRYCNRDKGAEIRWVYESVLRPRDTCYGMGARIAAIGYRPDSPQPAVFRVALSDGSTVEVWHRKR